MLLYFIDFQKLYPGHEDFNQFPKYINNIFNIYKTTLEKNLDYDEKSPNCEYAGLLFFSIEL